MSGSPDPSPPKVVVDLDPLPRRGNGLVIVVYVLATAALAASIYARWYA